MRWDGIRRGREGKSKGEGWSDHGVRRREEEEEEQGVHFVVIRSVTFTHGFN